jgi:hypothetical protein
MPNSPVVVISSPSPLLEGIARAVLGGATEEHPTEAPLVVLADPEGSLASKLSSPFVFLGYRADSPESRRTALKTLTELTSKAPPPLHVALFEAVARGSAADPAPPASEGTSVTDSATSSLTPRERFVIDRGPGGEFTGFLELARARVWGARVYGDWLSQVSPPPTELPRRDPSILDSRSVPWCGATE